MLTRLEFVSSLILPTDYSAIVIAWEDIAAFRAITQIPSTIDTAYLELSISQTAQLLVDDFREQLWTILPQPRSHRVLTPLQVY